MKNRRTFTVGFKQQVVQELLGGSSVGQASRKYEISASVIRRWQERYLGGKLEEGPTSREKALASRVGELERMVGRLTMENDFLKKAEAHRRRMKSANTCVFTAKTLAESREAANS